MYTPTKLPASLLMKSDWRVDESGANRPGSLGFGGELLEPGTRYYLFGSGYRAYNPQLMRFNSPDDLSPFGRGGLNAYAYCLGDPVNLVDPDGHVPLIRALAQLRKLFGRAASRLNKPRGMKRLLNSSSSSIGSAPATPPPPRPPKSGINAPYDPATAPPVPPRKPVSGTSYDPSTAPSLPPRKAVTNGQGTTAVSKTRVGNTAVPDLMEDASQLNLDEASRWLASRPHRKEVPSRALLFIGEPVRSARETAAGNIVRKQATLRDGIRQ